MSSQSQPVPVSALHEILDWSQNLPAWQRDALRRIVSQEAIHNADIGELYSICRSTLASCEPGHTVVSRPLAATDLPPAPGEASSVVLLSIGEFEHVNRLPSDQVLKFGDGRGLTIVYGDNGAGKSGYVRVVKRACRTRGVRPAIRPNAFQPHPKSPASAKIVFQIAGTEHSYRWTDGLETDPRLANVFVFDSTTASHYLEEDGPAIFTPHGLDVLPKLSRLCDEIRGRLQQDITDLENEIEAIANSWQLPRATAVGKLIDSLAASTKPSDVDALAVFSTIDAERLKTLNEALKADPKLKAKETRAAAARLRTFSSKIAVNEKELCRERCCEIRKAIEDAAAAQAAAEAFATGTFDATYLPGTGGSLWRSLFEAARVFSVQQAYYGQEFPGTSKDVRCLLCQQIVEPPAMERFRAFDRFCKDTSQQHAEHAANRLNQIANRVAALELLASEFAKVDADLSGLTGDQRAAVDVFVRTCDQMIFSLKKSLADRTWIDLDTCPYSPVDAINQLATTLDERAKMEESADDPAAKAKLLAEREELAAREWLAAAKDDVIAQIVRYKRLAMLRACQKETNTRAITEKSTNLTQKIVTEAFCTRFAEEAKALGLRTLSVNMEEIKGKKGETRFGLRLQGGAEHKVHDIASEGEQRCIALAAFLAELSQASHHSSLVFDDPVSSLDHWHQQRIAKRLAKEAENRQVIVFTHNTAFLHDLQQAVSESALEPCVAHLEWSNRIPGICREGLPWDWKSPKDRFDKLEKRHRELRAKWNPNPNEENNQDMRLAYSWLRATLERIVEKLVFADVVFRFRSYVKVPNLNEVIGFSVQECAEIQRLMQRCHDVTEAHDPSICSAVVPDPTDFLRDVESTKALVDLIEKRKKRVKEAMLP